MNKESLEKMSRMRLLGMHQAFKTSIEAERNRNSLPMMNWYTTWYKASGMTGSTVRYKEGLRTPTSAIVPV